MAAVDTLQVLQTPIRRLNMRCHAPGADLALTLFASDLPRSIYRLLREYELVIGLWTSDDAVTDLCMYQFSWAPGAVIGGARAQCQL